MMANHFFAIVAVGSNLPDAEGGQPLQTCERAVRAIARLPGVSSLTRSRWFSSAPVPPSDQPRYVNGVVRLRTDIPPTAFMARLQAIETAAGRVRPMPNAARTLDLDIIDMGGLVRSMPDPVLPHPRAHLRGFVLLPLRDVAPGWTHPVTGTAVGALLAGLPMQDVVPC